MSALAVVRLDSDSSAGIAHRLRLWFDDLSVVDRTLVEELLGHSISFLLFQVPEGFIEGILPHWVPERHVFRFGQDELTPTLEEYARFSGLSLEGPCARVSAGRMHRQFLTFTGLRKAALLSVVSSGHTIPFHFLLDRFSSPDSFSSFQSDFSVSEDRWRILRVEVLMACILSVVYMPAGDDCLDVRVVMAVRALSEGHTILPMILAETYMSSSYCQSFPGRVFRGSSILLYVWTMSHLRPIGHLRRHGFCFSHSLARQFSFRPERCIDVASWAEFFSVVEEPFSLLIYSGYCSSMSFLVRMPTLDFIPISGLRGVTTYHPLAVMGQFDQMQDFHLFTGATDYRFIISPQTERELLRVYDLWPRRVFAEFSDSHPGRTPEYVRWLHGGPEMASFAQPGALDDPRTASPTEAVSEVAIPPEVAGVMARSDVGGVAVSTYASHSTLENRLPDLVIEGDRIRSALSAVELERDIARAERDAAFLARDAAITDRDAVVSQARAVMDAHSETVRLATALLDRIDLAGQQIAGEPETSEASATLSFLLQLISDL